jgi:transcriptional regulator NrdR family protein
MSDKKTSGIKCPKCGGYDTFVRETYRQEDEVRRIRTCRDCRRVTITIERRINA